VTARTEDRDLENLCRMMIVVRTILVGGALSLIAFLAATGLETRNALLVTGLLLVVFPLSMVWWLLFKSGYAFEKLVYAQLMADLGLATGMVYCTGGALSHFTLLYFITILLASIILSMKGALLTATLSAVLYTVASVVEHARYEGATLAATRDIAAAYLVLNIGLQVAFFYFVAVLSGYLSRRIGVFGARLNSTARELQKIRTDTHSIIESMSSGFVIIDSDFKVTEFNRSASRMLAVPISEAIGRKAAEVIEPLSSELHQKIMDALVRGKEEERGEVKAVTREGRDVPLGVSTSLLEDDDGRTRGVVLIFQDLTDVKRMAERMRLADRLAALGEMSAAIAHEIRTPLASISGSVEMLKDSLDVQGENRQLLELVVKESDRLKSIIDHFLEFARSRPSKLREVALDSILKEVMYLVRNHPSFNNGVRVELDVSSVVKAWVDEETIKQVFYNLALNAVEALPSGGSLKIKLGGPVAEEGTRYASVTFEDNGMGMDQADLKQVFEPFFTRKKAGTGLGLAIASKIVEEHGGKIEMKTSKGLGTAATVYLPLDRSEDTKSDRGFYSSHVLVEAAKQGGEI
jgi:two-component system sensor histidine kinase PilS (NtrC family)